ncbi:hypothetical protein [Paenibacillus agricola]|uniref:Uncharacterized protein n=1 Tax=Paenibacillus agricola TaxID=2716264 RepID=A0ABX0J9V6_9BACL|nr:hypothetical protein [Paenibacillus agricola]NHN33215.1 hypothetical protein [Paenibacillus agricola]
MIIAAGFMICLFAIIGLIISSIWVAERRGGIKMSIQFELAKMFHDHLYALEQDSTLSNSNRVFFINDLRTRIETVYKRVGTENEFIKEMVQIKNSLIYDITISEEMLQQIKSFYGALILSFRRRDEVHDFYYTPQGEAYIKNIATRSRKYNVPYDCFELNKISPPTLLQTEGVNLNVH